MPLASASSAPVSTIPWESKGREGTCQDAGTPESGHLAGKNNSAQPRDHRKCLHGTSLPEGIVVPSGPVVVCVSVMRELVLGVFKEPGLRKVMWASNLNPRDGGKGGQGLGGSLIPQERTLNQIVMIMAASCCFWWTYSVSDTSRSFMYFLSF